MKAIYNDQSFQQGIKKLASLMEDSTNTVILTGAGMDTQSDIPDFRSKDGWWKKMDPSVVASAATMKQNYPLFQDFYITRIKMLQNVKPHPGHLILAELEREGLIQSIATQNVSSLHQLAGSKKVYELHGNIREIKCGACNTEAKLQDFLDKKSCHTCGENLLRPNVVLFGERLPQKVWHLAEQDIRQSDLLIVIGTSLKVSPVNQLPLLASGKIVLINNEDVVAPAQFDLKIIGPAQETLEELSSSLA